MFWHIVSDQIIKIWIRRQQKKENLKRKSFSGLLTIYYMHLLA